MWNLLWPMLMVVGANTVYNICAKSTPEKLNSFAALTINYGVAAALSLLLFFVTTGGEKNLIQEIGKTNWAPVVMGLSVVGLELGYILIYRAGWKVSVGSLVCNIALDLGMDVYGYDPYLSVDAALRLDRHVHVVKDVNELYKVSDYVTIHVPYTSSTKDFINGDAIAKMKGGVRILNLARGELVCDQDMIAALETGRVAKYVTDFPNDTIATVKNVIAMPHLGASTPESEENCAVMAARQLQDYLVNGNIRNSVNLPNLEQEWSGISRLCLIHKNVPAMLTNIMSTLSNDGINVENMTNKSKKDYAYTIVDVNTRITDQVANELRAIPGVIRVRVLNH